MRPIYIFAGLAVLFVIYSQQQQTMQAQLLANQSQYNLDKQQLALQAANSPAGIINSVVGGLGSVASLAGYGLD